MGWECIEQRGTLDRRFPHVESAKFWFIDNPRYEVQVSGPHLCTDLWESGQNSVAATFDVWGNIVLGLHGYYLKDIAAGNRRIEFFEMQSGGYHDPGPHYGDFNSETDRKQHPELYSFPLDIFK